MRTRFTNLEKEYQQEGIAKDISDTLGVIPERKERANAFAPGFPMKEKEEGTVSSSGVHPFGLPNIIRQALSMKMIARKRIPESVMRVMKYSQQNHRKFFKKKVNEREKSQMNKRFDVLDDIAELIQLQRMEFESRILLQRDFERDVSLSRRKLYAEVKPNALGIFAEKFILDKQQSILKVEEKEVNRERSENLEKDLKPEEGFDCSIF